MRKTLLITLVVILLSGFIFSVSEAYNETNYGYNPQSQPVNLVKDPNFANFGSLTGPWGINVLYSKFGIWWNSRYADSFAKTINLQGGDIHTALYINNKSLKSPHVYGTTAQRIRGLTPGKTYRIALWGAVRGQRSAGAVNIAIDPEWKIRPIHLQSGTTGWLQYSGTFVASNTYIDLRIISEDIGEALITGVTLTPVN